MCMHPKWKEMKYTHMQCVRERPPACLHLFILPQILLKKLTFSHTLYMKKPVLFLSTKSTHTVSVPRCHSDMPHVWVHLSSFVQSPRHKCVQYASYPNIFYSFSSLASSHIFPCFVRVPRCHSDMPPCAGACQFLCPKPADREVHLPV